MRAFLYSLRNHPGVPVVFLMQVMGFLSGTLRSGGGDNFLYALTSAGAMSIFWIPVLWTAWRMREQYCDTKHSTQISEIPEEHLVDVDDEMNDLPKSAGQERDCPPNDC